MVVLVLAASTCPAVHSSHVTSWSGLVLVPISVAATRQFIMLQLPSILHFFGDVRLNGGQLLVTSLAAKVQQVVVSDSANLQLWGTRHCTEQLCSLNTH